jgi:predicted protein tyrosine phosphatase
MINKLIITDLATAESYAKGPQQTYNLWVSVIDKEDKPKIQEIRKHLHNKGAIHFHQFFYDWSDEHNDPFIKKHISAEGPQKEHIQNIISFLTPHIHSPKIHNLAVHCYAGISRSSAVAVIAHTLSGKSPDEALQAVLKVRPHAWPNLRILKFGSEILGIDIHNPVKKWKSEAGLFIP